MTTFNSILDIIESSDCFFTFYLLKKNYFLSNFAIKKFLNIGLILPGNISISNNILNGGLEFILSGFKVQSGCFDIFQ
jgi:hypothetical protein